MSDFKLTDQSTGRNDLDITNGKLTLVTDETEATAQRVRMKLQSFFGECVYNRSGGTPWMQPGNESINGAGLYIFENTNDPEGNARAVLTEVLRTVEGVASVVYMNVSWDRSARELTGTGKVRTTTGTEFTFDLPSVAP